MASVNRPAGNGPAGFALWSSAARGRVSVPEALLPSLLANPTAREVTEQSMGEVFEFDHADPLALAGGETQRANLALRDYALLGPGRSLARLVECYQTAPKPPPTRRLETVKDWSARFAWQARVALYERQIRHQLVADDRDERERERQQRLSVCRRMRAAAWERLQVMDPAELTPRDVLRYVAQSSRELRIDLEAEPEQGPTVADWVATLTTEQLRTLYDILENPGRPATAGG